MQKNPTPHLKFISIAFSLLLGITGCVPLVFGLMTARSNMKIDITNVTALWTIVIALSIICLSCMAALGAYKEDTVLLKGVIRMMSIGSATMVIITVLGSLWITTKNVDTVFKANMNEMKSLTHFDHSYQLVLHITERESHCCGVTGYSDYKEWRTEIPSSCECSSQHENTDLCISVSPSSNQTDMETIQVYKEACGQIFLTHIREGIHTALVAIWSLIATAFVGFLLCSALLLQISGYYKPPLPAEVVRMVNARDDGNARA